MCHTGTWQGHRMPQSRSPAAGGFFIAIGVMAGAAVGFLRDQVTAGLLAGLALGVIVALAMWWRSR